MWIEDGTEGRVCTWYRSGFSVSVGHLFYGTLCKTYLNEKLVVKQHAIDNVPYFEKRLGATAIHSSYCMEPENDFWMHAIVFDRSLTE